MALFSFTRAILEGKPIEIYGDGRMRRDFTYIDDVVEGISLLRSRPPAPYPRWDAESPDPATSSAPYSVHNIGHHSTIEVLRLIEILEDSLGIKAKRTFVASNGCEVAASYADTSDLEQDTGFVPATSLETGVQRFVEWYREFYRI
jgi:UDP-glucuronate 4-epimerase